mgnify:FL=1
MPTTAAHRQKTAKSKLAKTETAQGLPQNRKMPAAKHACPQEQARSMPHFLNYRIQQIYCAQYRCRTEKQHRTPQQQKRTGHIPQAAVFLIHRTHYQIRKPRYGKKRNKRTPEKGAYSRRIRLHIPLFSLLFCPVRLFSAFWSVSRSHRIPFLQTARCCGLFLSARPNTKRKLPHSNRPFFCKAAVKPYFIA